MGGGITTGNTSTIYIGKLALDIKDTANHDLVWRIVVSKTIDKTASLTAAEDLINSVAKLLKNYPPAKAKVTGG